MLIDLNASALINLGDKRHIRSAIEPTIKNPGDTWEEIESSSGNLIAEWTWNSQGYWFGKSLIERAVNASSVGASPTNLFFFPINPSGHDYFVYEFHSIFQVATTNNSTNYWVLDYCRLSGSSIVTIGTQNTSQAAANAWTGDLVGYNGRVDVSAAETKSILCRMTKVGSPGNIAIANTIRYRLIRN